MRGMERMHVPEIIAELLVLTGETQKQLAKRFGVSQSQISKWKSGEREPSKSEWEAIQDLYFKMKGWRSFDERMASFDLELHDTMHRILDQLVRDPSPKRRR